MQANRHLFFEPLSKERNLFYIDRVFYQNTVGYNLEIAMAEYVEIVGRLVGRFIEAGKDASSVNRLEMGGENRVCLLSRLAIPTLFCPGAFIETQKIVVDLASIIQRENPVTGAG